MGTAIGSGIDYAALFAGAGAAISGGTGNLLDTLEGVATSGAPLVEQNPIAALQTAEKNKTKDIATTAAEPQIARAVAAFEAAVQQAKTPAQLLANPAVLQVLLTANGLGDQTAYGALAKQVLLSDPSDPKSLVNKISDTRWLPVVQTYDLAKQGLAVIQNPKVMAAIANGYAEYSWLDSLDQVTPGLSNALTFLQQASSFTSVDQLLGNNAAFQVVTGALGIPEQVVFQPLEAEEKAVTSRLDITKLQDPKFVESFVERYLVNQAASASASNTTPSLEALAARAEGLVV